MVAQVGQDAGGLATGAGGQLKREVRAGQCRRQCQQQQPIVYFKSCGGPSCKPSSCTAPAGLGKPSLRPHLRAASGGQVPVAALGKGLGAGHTGQCDEGPAVGAKVHGAEEEVLSCMGEGGSRRSLARAAVCTVGPGAAMHADIDRWA